MTEVRNRLGATLELSLAATAVVAVAIPLGVVSGRYYRAAVDYFVLLIGTVGLSVPPFWFGLVMIWLFAVRWPLLPVSGREGWQALVMPALSLAIGAAAVMARTVRISIVEVLQENYIRAARARGLTEYRIVFKHALRAALIPAVTLVGLNFGAMLANAVVVETVFSWPGMGWLLFQALQYRDFPVIQGLTVVLALLFVLTNFLVDLLYAVLDPRIRYG